MLLKDKIIVVSGIGPGMGVKLAIEAAREGAAGVVVAARTAANLDDAERRILALGGNAAVLKCVTDITDEAQCEALVTSATRCFGRIDALVNSAYDPGPRANLSVIDLDAVERALATNVFGTLKLTRAVIPQMKRQGNGAIVLVSTMGVRKVVDPVMGGYAISKAPLDAMVKHLAHELGPCGIRVNLSYNGLMWGVVVEDYVRRLALKNGGSESEIKAAFAARIPLARIPTDDECARAVLFLASDYASAVTGATLDINGGEYMP